MHTGGMNTVDSLQLFRQAIAAVDGALLTADDRKAILALLQQSLDAAACSACEHQTA